MYIMAISTEGLHQKSSDCSSSRGITGQAEAQPYQIRYSPWWQQQMASMTGGVICCPFICSLRGAAEETSDNIIMLRM